MIKLSKGAFLGLRHTTGKTVTAHAGEVWITEQDEPRDVMLRPGQQFTLSPPGLAIPEALSDASISVES
jgi:hypothetical protein